MWEERSIALLREAIPDLTPKQEMLERRFTRAMTALVPGTWGPEEEAGVEEALAALGVGGEVSSAFASQHRRFHALADADPEDPRVTALASEALATLRDVFAALPQPASGDRTPVGAEHAQQAVVGLAAALDVLAPAQRRVMELVLPQLFDATAADGA